MSNSGAERESLTIEQALQDRETAAAVAALTAVQSQGYLRTDRLLNNYAQGDSSTQNHNGQPGGKRDLEMSSNNMYQNDVPESSWDKGYHIPQISTLNDDQAHAKALQGITNSGIPVYDSQNENENASNHPGEPQHKKRRTTTGSSANTISQSEPGPLINMEEYDQEEEDNEEFKRRRIQRACDLCRRKKIRCDGAHSSRRNQKCSNCAEGKTDCTYVEAAKRRGPPAGYIETLEWKVARLEALARDLSPMLDLTREVGPPISRDTFELDTFKSMLSSLSVSFIPPPSRKSGRSLVTARNRKGSGSLMAPIEAKSKSPQSYDSRQPQGISLDTWAGSSGSKRPNTPSMSPATSVLPDYITGQGGFSQVSTMGPSTDSNDAGKRKQYDRAQEMENNAKEEEENQKFVGSLTGECLGEGYRYLGQSSGVGFLRSAMDYKDAIAGPSSTAAGDSRRAQYWGLPIWEASVSQCSSHNLDFSRWPDPLLAEQLIGAYFEHDNIAFPLLNRIVFQRDYAAGRWRQDESFAKVCLLVFALAARHVDDPKVYWFADDPVAAHSAMEDMTMYRQSAGWRWMEMVAKMGKSFLKAADLEDLQTFVLCAYFLHRSAVISTVWAVAGMGLKQAIDIGIHTRVGIKRCATRRQAELYKRAFWCLVAVDRTTSASMGRILTLQDEDFDIDYPIDVDDEYWETGNPETDFKQPEGKASKISMFISYLKLSRISAYALKHIYTVNKLARGVAIDNPDFQKKLVAELDSDLYAWLDQVPAHLKWDPQRKDSVFFQQSSVLYAAYYFTQILIHRPFIPTARTAPSVAALALPSLAICTNAARSCARVVAATYQRQLTQYHTCTPAFTSAIVLLIGVWGGNRTGTGLGAVDRATSLEDVRHCLRYLKMEETWWRGAGRMRDVLMELANISDTSVDTPASQFDSESGRRSGRKAFNTGSTAPSPLGTDPDNEVPHTRLNDHSTTSAVRSSPAVPRPLGSQRAHMTERSLTEILDPQAPKPWWFVPKESGAQGLESVSFDPFGSRSDPSLGNGINFGNEHLLNQVPGSMYNHPPFARNNNVVMPQSVNPEQFPAEPYNNRGYVDLNSGIPSNKSTGDFWNVAPDANSVEMSGVLADIWSMAPDTFEMDQWSLYLSQAQPVMQNDAGSVVNGAAGMPSTSYL